MIPARHCLNLAVSVATVLYDRQLKRALLGDQAARVTPGEWEQRCGGAGAARDAAAESVDAWLIADGWASRSGTVPERDRQPPTGPARRGGSRFAPVPGRRPAMERKRVLVVEDDADLREFLRQVLGDVWEVIEAGDGEQALAAARSRPPDLVLLDLGLPGMSGARVAAVLRSEAATVDVPIVAATGDHAAAQEPPPGVSGVLFKPYRLVELLACLERFLGAPA